ncbi:Cyclic AMP-dependent transcription factor ATF-5 [Clarias magur]|uniref:Cyclic AMP-dependent transcription factor ATF-5 n=1 Tax=Clarias magur TaxID=1594786 RepID=A0A8J4U8R6_CLAMG|nr:Cyclic AMP-dependent transcription factor ATF-5 [Clarias magur]
MMAMSAPIWKALLGCPADPLTLSHPQANHSQLERRRGEGPEESQHLIGDGLSDWMTEEVDFSSYLPTPHSSPSPNASLPPSPLQHDIQVPSDLEVMTSLLQEELAQLEDYFLSDPLPEKVSKLGKCDKGPPPVGPSSYYQLPYASYSASSQSESSPLLVTLATGELDLLSLCGGPIGRSKMPRHTPYGCSRPSANVCSRKRVSDGVKASEGYENGIWSSKGNTSGNSAVTLNGSYSCVEDERVVGKGYCLGSAVEIRRCAILPKEEKNCRYSDEAIGISKVVSSGYGFGGPIQIPHKKDEMMMYGVREVSMNGMDGSGEMEMMSENKASVGDVVKANIPWKTESNEGCYLQGRTHDEAYHNFLGTINEPVKAEGIEMHRQHSEYQCSFLDGQGPECLSGDRHGHDMGAHCPRGVCALKEETCILKPDLDVSPIENNQGERKQKKRDQNKTAAHRYRQRKRAELDSLEEQLHGLEGRNRELRDKAESVEREIQYVKDLLIEVYKARSQRLKQEASA